MSSRGPAAMPFPAPGTRSWAGPALLGLVAGLTVVDVVWSETIAATVVVAPFICALIGSERATATVAAAAVASAALSPLWNHDFGDGGYIVRLLVVIVGSGFALAGARGRTRLSRDRERFRILTAVAEISERTPSPETTLDRIGDIIVPALADVFAIDVLHDGQAERLTVVADARLPGDVTSRLRARGATGATARATEESLVPAYDDERLRAMALDEEDLAFIRSLRLRSTINVPLRARGVHLGVLIVSVADASRRDYDEDDLAFVRVLAGRIALALDNAGLFSEIETLVAQQAAALGSLAEAVTMQDESGTVVYANEAAARSLGFASVDDLLATPPSEIVTRFDSYLEDGSPMREELLPGRQVLAGEEPKPLLLRTVNRRTGDEYWRITKATGVRDAAGHVRLAVNVIEDVTEVKRVEHAQRLLAEAGAVLASSLDYEETLSRVAELAIGELADWCGVVLPGDHGFLRSVAVAHVDQAKVRFARELNERYPQRMDDSTGAAEVIRTGVPQVFNEIPDELLAESVPDPEQLQAIRNLGMHAAMIVPMVAAGRSIGAISFVTAESGRRFSDTDRELAEELGRRAGTAVENARLYTERSHIANTLQASLLPAGLPSMPGFTLASLYRPAGAENWVGGDFYDAFETTAGWMVVVGDVAGRGAEAAALTAQARHTLRTAAQLIGDPVAAVAHLNRALAELRTTSLCTVAALQLTDRAGAVEATVVCGGHPRPYLVRDGDAREIGRWGPMVGAFADSSWTAERFTLRPGDVVVLYTDGVIDANGSDERFGDERLAATLSGTGDASDAVGRIRRALEAFEVGEQADDTAVLAIAFTGDRVTAR